MQGRIVRDITHIVIHESRSRFGDVPRIRNWHIARGFSDIGYNLVIGNGYPHTSLKYVPESDGAVWGGRDLDHDGDFLEEQGAHSKMFNRHTLGICLIGDGKFSRRQLEASHGASARLCIDYGLTAADVIGHCETPYELNKPIDHPDRDERRTTCPVTPMPEFRLAVQTSIHVIRASDRVMLMGSPLQ